jgi:hypothetical protein
VLEQRSEEGGVKFLSDMKKRPPIDSHDLVLRKNQQFRIAKSLVKSGGRLVLRWEDITRICPARVTGG